VQSQKQLHNATIIHFFNQTKQNPNSELLLSGCTPAQRQTLRLTQSITPPVTTTEAAILSQPPTDPHTIDVCDAMTNMLAHVGICGDLADPDILPTYRAKRPPLVRYINHVDYFRAPVQDELACMNNDIHSAGTNCMAQLHHQVCLRVGPSTPAGERGICIYCERFTIVAHFLKCYFQKTPSPIVLNTYRYAVNKPGEYSSDYMIFHESSPTSTYGILNNFPQFLRDRYIRSTHSVIVDGQPTPVRGLVESQECFFQL